jgi:hypothetical protein
LNKHRIGLRFNTVSVSLSLEPTGKHVTSGTAKAKVHCKRIINKFSLLPTDVTSKNTSYTVPVVTGCKGRNISSGIVKCMGTKGQQ